MEFTFETSYNQKALTTMAKALRKTIRKKRSRRSHMLGWIVMIMGALLAVNSLRSGVVFNAKNIVTWLAILAIFIVFIWEDALNGYIASKRMLKGTEKATSIFTEEGFASTTEIGKSEWNYDKVLLVVDMKKYFVFIYSANHAQVYDKSSILGGTVEGFGVFIEGKTGKKVVKIS